MTCGYCGDVMQDDSVERDHFGMACVKRLRAEVARLTATLEAAQGALAEMWNEVREACAILGGPDEMCLIDRAKHVRLAFDIDREIGSERIELKAEVARLTAELAEAQAEDSRLMAELKQAGIESSARGAALTAEREAHAKTQRRLQAECDATAGHVVTLGRLAKERTDTLARADRAGAVLRGLRAWLDDEPRERRDGEIRDNVLAKLDALEREAGR